MWYHTIHTTPDNIRDGIIEELKIISSGSREGQLEYACVQANIYCYLAGLYKYRIRLFDVPILAEEKIEYPVDYVKASKDIRKAISIMNQLYEILKL